MSALNMQAWKNAASQYLPLSAIDEDEEQRRSSHDSGSSRTLAGTPDELVRLARCHSQDPEEDSAASSSTSYPPDLKKSFPSIYQTHPPRRPSRIAYIVILLSGTVVVLTVLLIASLSGSLLPSSKQSTVADIAQALADANTYDYDDEGGNGEQQRNITVDEALQRLKKEGWIPIDSSRSSPFVPARRTLVPLASQKQTTYACAEQWIAKGELCSAIKKGSMKDSEIDVAWTWVTANEHWTGWRERLSQGMERLRWLQKRKQGDAAKNAKDRHFRSHHQLKYSQRSIIKNLPFTKRLHLLANDLPACDPHDRLCSNTHEDRIGQIPEWLEPRIAMKSGTGFDLQFHWDLFKADDEDAGAWRARKLPTFDR